MVPLQCDFSPSDISRKLHAGFNLLDMQLQVLDLIVQKVLNVTDPKDCKNKGFSLGLGKPVC